MINGLWPCLLASNNNVEIIKAYDCDDSDIREADILFDRLDRDSVLRWKSPKLLAFLCI